MALNINDTRSHTSTILSAFGTTVTVKRPTTTKDSMGRPVSPSETTVGTFTADVQFLTKGDEELIRQGWAEMGDARVFFKHSADIQEKDIIETGSSKWIVTKILDAPEVGGSTDFQEVIARKTN